MKKIVLFFALMMTTLFMSVSYGQVSIGTLNPPDKSAVLDLVSDTEPHLGMLIPRMSEDERDKIENPANGLLIFNTDESCVNYYKEEEEGTGSWNSLCGGLSKSTATATCDDVIVYGVYMAGTPLNSSNYLTIDVDVEKAGVYTIAASTTNGYGFSASGTFLNTGLQQVILSGQGSPKVESAGDELSFSINGSTTNFSCEPPSVPVMVQVAPANPTFTMDCSSVTVNGVYSTGISLKPTNNITLSVNVTALGNGEWTASTNTVDGISFSGNGIFTSTGTQIITLFGSGTPASAKAKTMTITINSTGIVKTCTAIVNSVYTTKKIAVMGYASEAPIGGANNNTYGYELTGNRASYRVVMNPINFGTTSTSTVQVQGFSITGVDATNSSIPAPPSVNGKPTDATVQAALNNKPDIVIIGWGMIYSQAMIDAFIDYLHRGGVMIIMNKYSNSTRAGNTNDSEAPFFSQLFGTTVTAGTITDASGNVLGGGTSYGSIFRLATVSGDPILKGPFGDLNGLLWGNDYFPATYMSGIPANQIITYSGANNIAKTGSFDPGVTMFRHTTFNLFWVGDGGFLSNERINGGTYGSNNIEPFATDDNLKPVAKINFGSGAAYGGTGQTVYNAQLFANVLTWAIQQAENNGINSGAHTGVSPDPTPDLYAE